MQVRVQIGATVADDRETVVGVGRREQGGQNDAAGRNAIKDQRIDVLGAQDHREIGAGEGADPVLGNDNFILARCDRSRDCCKRLLK